MIKGLASENGRMVMRESPESPLKPGEIRVAVEFASFKHGTTANGLSGESPFQERRFDLSMRLFVPAITTPISLPSGIGYHGGQSVVGTVCETDSAVSRFKTGDRVFGVAPICDRVAIREDQCHRLESPMNEYEAVCVDPAYYALGGVRDARVGVSDEVMVMGLGAIGLFGVQLLTLAGCRTVITADLCRIRRDAALVLGADAAFDPSACEVALETRALLGHGADIAIEYSGSYCALADAIRSVRQCGRVAVVGYYKGKDTGLELGAEFFHNRIELIASLPAWGNPSRDYPQWDGIRLKETVIDLFRKRRLTARTIIDREVRFADAADAFNTVIHDPTQAIKLGIRF